MDMQALFDALCQSARDTRSKYQLTLGDFIEALSDLPANASVQLDYDRSLSLSHPHSYRGYYADLAFEPEPNDIPVAVLQVACCGALGKTFKGYKGGDFTMGRDAPVWIAPYGCTGRAAMSVEMDGDVAVVITKEVE